MILAYYIDVERAWLDVIALEIVSYHMQTRDIVETRKGTHVNALNKSIRNNIAHPSLINDQTT